MIKVDRWRERGTRARFLSGPVGRKGRRRNVKKRKRKEKKRGKEKNSQTRFTPAPKETIRDFYWPGRSSSASFSQVLRRSSPLGLRSLQRLGGKRMDERRGVSGARNEA